MPIKVDESGFTRVDAAGGKPQTICLAPKRDEFMKFYLDGLMSTK
jgi:hypothetical protein